jgi:hypothetical protein
MHDDLAIRFILGVLSTCVSGFQRRDTNGSRRWEGNEGLSYSGSIWNQVLLTIPRHSFLLGSAFRDSSLPKHTQLSCNYFATHRERKRE